jgi:hypothetical protein
VPVGPFIIAVHLLLVVVAAFFVGMQFYRQTRPTNTEIDADHHQLQRLRTAISIGMFLLLLALVAGLDLGLGRVAKVIR